MRIHYRNPADTPNQLHLNAGIGPGLSSDYCGPYYLDSIYMNLGSVQNGISVDTLSIFSPGSDDIAICGHNKPYNDPASATGIFTDWTKIGFLNCCDALTFNGSSYDTTGSWYNGIQPTVISGHYTFTNVSLWTVQIGDATCPRFAFPTDLYILPDHGIIKFVQHLPNRDVKWDLINYHISN